MFLKINKKTIKLMKAETLQLVKQKHQEWIVNIRQHLDGKKQLKQKIVTSSLSCELGKWYYPEGEKRYANLKEMEYIIAKHNKLHEVASFLWVAHEKNENEIAETYYIDLIEISDKINKKFDEIILKLSN
jgi:hypothetical protein